MSDLLALVRALTHHLPDLPRFLNARGTPPYCIDAGTIRIHVAAGLTSLVYRVERTGRPSRVLPFAIAHANGREGQ